MRFGLHATMRRNHLHFARPFLEAGVPLYIDKPIALSLAEFDALYELEQYTGQIFSCSALRFSPEMQLTSENKMRIGALRLIVGTCPNGWDFYAMHLIDPLLNLVGYDVSVKKIASFIWQTGGGHYPLRFQGGQIFCS